jgi:phenylpyruvate tautomerase PptA (4-oxalocrotonate tautomerase family)
MKMPHVIIQTVRGILDNNQKKQLLEGGTDVLVEARATLSDFFVGQRAA